MVSVLMSVYNEKPDYLEESIRSVINQTFRDFEFIIVNDGCDNECVSIIEKYKNIDQRIIIVNNDINIGLTKSLNKGLEIARGKYIARMDSDDSCIETRLEKQVSYMESHNYVVVLGTNACDFRGRKLQVIHSSYDFEATKIRMLFFNAGVYHPSAMIRTAFIRKNNIRYNEKYLVSQDYRMWVDVIMAGGVLANLEEALIKYRIHKDQITSKKQSLQKEYTIQTQKVYLDYMLSKGCMDNVNQNNKESVQKLITSGSLIQEMLSLSQLTKPLNVDDSLMSIRCFIDISGIDKSIVTREILMRYFRRGVHLIRHDGGVGLSYFFNSFFLKILFPRNLLYAINYYVFNR